MPIEFLGWTIKPELSIGDIAAIGAIIASAVVFSVGYSRSRKSEQIKIARDLYSRIDELAMNTSKFVSSTDFSLDWSPEYRKKWFSEALLGMAPIVRHISYFTYLVRLGEINDKNIIEFYRTSILDLLNKTNDIYNLANNIPDANEVMIGHREAKYPEKVQDCIRIWNQAGRSSRKWWRILQRSKFPEAKKQ